VKHVCDINKCTGCAACVQVCPKKCIKMLPNKKGHIVSVIDEKQCVNCGHCIRICPINNKPTFNFPKKCYATWAKNEHTRTSCSSGGICTILSEYIINTGGIVYGCASLKNLEFKHVRVDNIKDLEFLRGSKYVFSSCEDIYIKIKQDLLNNKKVLFIGTPCQNAGVLNYIGNNESLYTINLICHGVPSQQMLKESYDNKIDVSNINSVSFRENNNFKMKYTNSKGKINTICDFSKARWENYYYEAFFRQISFRSSCYDCIFAKSERIGDITLGDFWGLGKKEKFEYSIKKGCSVCLINTDKGQTLFNNIKNNIEFYERSINEAIEGNNQLRYSSQQNYNVKIFNFLYPKISFNKAVLISCFEKFLKYKIKIFIKKLIR